MARKKSNLTQEEKNQRKLQNLSKYYELAKGEGIVELTGDPIDDVHNLVMRCVDIQHEICGISDSIKYDDYEKVQEFTGIDKGTYLEFVRICALKNNDKLHDKAIKRFEADFEKKLLNTNLRYSFLNSYMNNDDEIKITDSSNEEFTKFEDYVSEEFNKIIEESTKKRERINLVLRRQYKMYQNAAIYISKLDLTNSDFKELVDYEVYKQGGYPSPTSPSKVWALFNKYARSLRLMQTYKFMQFDNLNNEFGIDVKLGVPHPQQHPWMREEKEID